jgi:hypothetical protein
MNVERIIAALERYPKDAEVTIKGQPVVRVFQSYGSVGIGVDTSDDHMPEDVAEPHDAPARRRPADRPS